MCKAKEYQILVREGMRLARHGEYRAAQMLLARALRLSLAVDSPMLEAKIRSNSALVFYMSGLPHLAMRQLVRAMRLTADKVGTDNRFYHHLQSMFEKALTRQAEQESVAA